LQAHREFQIIGRRIPTEADPKPKVFRMRIFAKNDVIAKSRFWYFMSKLQKVKKSKGELLAINELREKKPNTVKNFGIYLRYRSRTGIHNLHKEFRDTTRVGAVNQMYNEMASVHKATWNNINIIEVNQLTTAQTVRPNIQQFHDSKIKFPLTHRVQRVPMKRYRSTFVPKRPSTFW